MKIQSLCCLGASTENIKLHPIKKLRRPTGKDRTKGNEWESSMVSQKCQTTLHKGL